MRKGITQRRRILDLITTDPALLGLFVLFHILAAALLSLGIVPIPDLRSISTLDFREPNVLALAIEVVIYVLALSSFIRAARLSWSLRNEREAATELDEACRGEVARLRVPGIAPMTIEEAPRLWEDLPDTSLTVNLSDSLYEDALDRRFGSKADILGQAGTDTVADIAILNNRQRSALHIGILGTFLGFVFAMPSLVSLSSETFNSAAFGPLFASLKVCFTTSVAGLVASLTIGAAHTRVSRRFATCFKALDSALQKLIVVLRNARNDRHAVQAFEQLNHALDGVVLRLDRQHDQMEVQAAEYLDAMHQMQLARQALASSVSSVEQSREKILHQLESLEESANPDRILKQINTELHDTVEGIGEQLHAGVMSSVEAVRVSSAALRQATRALQRESDTQNASSKVMRDAVAGMSDSIGRSVQEGLAPAMEQFTTAMNRLTQEMERGQTQSARADPSLEKQKESRWSISSILSRRFSRAG